MDIDVPGQQEGGHDRQPSKPATKPQPQEQPKEKKTSSSSFSSSSTRELTTCTVKSPPFAYAHLSTVSLTQPRDAEIDPEALSPQIDPLQVRSYCTAALRQFLGETGTSIVPDILLIGNNTATSSCTQGQGREREHGRGRKRETDIYLRLPREDLGTFAAAITAFPGLPTTASSQNVNTESKQWLLLQVQSCGDWLGSLIGRSEEGDVWGH